MLSGCNKHKNINMGNCVPKKEDKIDRRSARATFFEAKKREKDTLVYTSSEFAKGEKAVRPPPSRKPRRFDPK